MANNKIKVGDYLIKLLQAVLYEQIPPPPGDLDLHRLYQLAAWHSVANMTCYGLVKVQPSLSPEALHPFLEARNKALLKEARQQLEVEMILTALEHSQLEWLGPGEAKGWK